jgi:chorismate lyase/3-hydroxybenzoate synthase
MPPAQLEDESFAAYQSIARQLAASGHRHPVRFWNHVPSINDPADAGRDVYMVFNAGRFRAFSQAYGGPAQFDEAVATASAIGHGGRDLLIHCLATDARGIPINNPRQVAPYHYSQRFGPLPPCFARATRLAHPAHTLLVGGTASVRGEDSTHLDDLPAQCNETFLNLAALVAAAAHQKLSARVKLSRWLSTFTELRVYYPNRADAAAIEAVIRAAFSNIKRLELLRADLCRAELLVEIEGVADLARCQADL